MDNDMICFCVGVTEKQLKDAIKGGLKTVDEVCKKTNAGTGCSSCRPKIQKLIDTYK